VRGERERKKIGGGEKIETVMHIYHKAIMTSFASASKAKERERGTGDRER
jgi:hypothetical protein